MFVWSVWIIWKMAFEDCTLAYPEMTTAVLANMSHGVTPSSNNTCFNPWDNISAGDPSSCTCRPGERKRKRDRE